MHPCCACLGDISYLLFYYGILTYVTISGKVYHVYEIVAYARGSSGPLYTEDTVNLLAIGTYTQVQFNRAISVLKSSLVSLIYPGWLPGDFIPNWSTFLSPGSTQRLELNYFGTSIFVYAYVSDGQLGYVPMQTSQRLTWGEYRRAIKVHNGVTTVHVGQANNIAASSQYYANVNQPATRYHNGNITIMRYSVGDIWFRVQQTDGTWQNKGKIFYRYFEDLGSIN